MLEVENVLEEKVEKMSEEKKVAMSRRSSEGLSRIYNCLNCGLLPQDLLQVRLICWVRCTVNWTVRKGERERERKL